MAKPSFKVKEEVVGNYFSKPQSSLQFIPSGCTLLDCALSGGWPLQRVSNIVGDKAVGKTLIAIEACANFHEKFPSGKIKYRESESAFDIPYSEALGMPIDVVDFGDGDFYTVEDWAKDIDKTLSELKGEVGLLVLDSLDALSDKAEIERDIGDTSYGTNKAKQLSTLFRKKVVQQIEASNAHLMIISQVRDNIGAGLFGEKHTRSGGHALDFYASQIVWLANLGKIEKTVKGIKRTIGVKVKAQVKKNKVGLPFRTVQFPIYFGYGIDDLEASLTWLSEEVDKNRKTEYIKNLGFDTNDYKKILKEASSLDDHFYFDLKDKVSALVKDVWAEVETDFLPTRKKYNR